MYSGSGGAGFSGFALISAAGAEITISANTAARQTIDRIEHRRLRVRQKQSHRFDVAFGAFMFPAVQNILSEGGWTARRLRSVFEKASLNEHCDEAIKKRRRLGGDRLHA